MIAEREGVPRVARRDVVDVIAEEARVFEVKEWLERRPTLRRPFVDNYVPKHRGEPAAD